MDEVGYSPCKSPGWQKPRQNLQMKKLKHKKRQLQDRFYENAGSPPKKTRTSTSSTSSRNSLKIQPPPPEDQTCEDSTLMDLLYMNKPYFNNSSDVDNSSPPNTVLSFSSLSQSSHSPVSSYAQIYLNNDNQHQIPSSSSSQLTNNSSNNSSTSVPIVVQMPTTPKRSQPKPAPHPMSPEWKPSRDKLRDYFMVRKLSLDQEDLVMTKKVVWRHEVCADWSLKSGLRISSSHPFGWTSMNLKASEESSGVSAFVRCIDIDPTSTSHTEKSSSFGHSQLLDRSMGAQFHQCSLYWQFPYIPGVNLFPRDNSSSAAAAVGLSLQRSGSSSSLGSQNQSSVVNNNVNVNGVSVRLEEGAIEALKNDWNDSFRSAFNILRARQNPFFYLCSQYFTCLFCAAGIQDYEQIQVYVTPASKAFRTALRTEGIEFTTPYHTLKLLRDKQEKNNSPTNGGTGSSGSSNNKTSVNKLNNVDDVEDVEEEEENSDDDEKWINEMGISGDLNLEFHRKDGTKFYEIEKSKSDLVLITGQNTLKFFNFLLNNKKFLTSTGGPLAGIPPTILAPVTFHGSCLKTLKIKQTKTKVADGSLQHTIEMTGPILPHIPHMISSLLLKNVQNFKIHPTISGKTELFNVNSIAAKTKEPFERVKANVFQCQNLSDCGLKKSIIEIFCRSDNNDTIRSEIECKNGLFRWS